MDVVPPAAPTVLLLDMDGVVRHWRAERVRDLEARYALPEGAVLETAFRVVEYADGLVGRATYEEWCDATASALFAEHGDAGLRAAVEWRSGRGEVDREVVALVRALPRRVRVGLLSNAHDNLRRDLGEFALLQLFEQVICSAEVGLAKPDPRIYAHAAARFGVPASAFLFVDDLPENVAAARVAGMASRVFTDAAALERTLREFGLLDSPS